LLKIRYLRTFEGIMKAQDDGYCWIDLGLWMKYEGLTFEDVGKAHQCGYCRGCMNN